jgi:Ca2+ transporting ATPase
MILDQFKDLLVLILLGAACVSIVLALLEDPEDRLAAFVEPAVIFIILILNATVGVLQESNAENAIEKLKESEAREAKVIRNGTTQSIHASELVPGDVVIVDVGDKVPADCRLISIFGAALSIDQSMLTGESEPVHKTVDRINKDNAVNQDKTNLLFSGTLCNSGRASAIVVFTGAWSQMGTIAENLKKKEGDDDDKTPLQHKLDEFGEQLSKVIGVICIVVWLINIGHFNDPVFGSWMKGAIYYLKIAVALAVAAIPEGLPAVVTTCLALGAMKMARKNAIVRHLPSVETLGCTTVICSDKTGTLTTNKMTVQKVLAVQGVQAGRVVFGRFDVSGDNFSPFGTVTSEETGRVLTAPALDEPALALIGKASALCNDSTIVYKPAEQDKAAFYDKTGAPTEAALMVLAEKIGVNSDKAQGEISRNSDSVFRASAAANFWNAAFRREHFLEFERGRKSMSVVGTEGKARVLYCKGAPEEILSRCKDVVDKNGKTASITKEVKAQIEEAFVGYAKQGLRCIALARRENPDAKADYNNIEAFRGIESNMTFIGMVGMLDPPRASVPEAIAKCRTAGIRVIVITGDNQITAESICRRIGVFGDAESLKGKSFTGVEFETMSQAGKEKAAAGANLFSRVEPRHKLELVEILRKQGQIVAMTGDGVNDAPALSR